MESSERGAAFVRRTHLELAFVTIIWCAALTQWTLHDLVVPWDSKNQFYAFYRFMAEAIHSGSTPFWNPYHYAGHPSSADPQSLIFALPFLVFALIDRAPSMKTFDALVLAHLLAGGWAIVFHGRKEGWPAAASILAASVFMLGGVVSGRMNHVGIICAYGLFPLALLLMRIALERNSMAAALGFALVASQIALGRSQVPLLLCALLCVAFVAQIAASGAVLKTLRTRFAVIATMSVGTFILLAPPLLLTLQFLNLSNRPATAVETALLSSLHPLNFATFLSADVFGSLQGGSDGWGPNRETLKGVDGTDRAFNYMFCGTLTALLLILHGLAGRRIVWPGRRMFALVLAFGIVYTIGRFTPAYEWLFANAPGVSLFRRPNDAAFLVVLCIAYLSGSLAADYIRHGTPVLNRPLAFLTAIAVAALVIAAIWFSGLSQKIADTAGSLAIAALVLSIMALVMAVARTPQARGALMSVLVLVTAGELVWRNAGNVLNARPAAEYALLEAPQGENALIVEVIKADMAKTSGALFRPRIEVLGMDGPWQNASMILGFEAINGYNPLRIGGYDYLIEPGESPHDVVRRAFPKSFPNYNCGLSRRLNLRYLVLDKPLENLPSKHDYSKFTPLLEGPSAWVYRNKDEAPRVEIRSQVRVVAMSDYDTAVDLLTEDGRVLVDSGEQLAQVYSSRNANSQVRITDWRVDRIELDVQTSAPAILKLNSPNYPGWEADVDGVEKPVITVDLLFRGVEIPAGSRKVILTFRPFSWRNIKNAFIEVFETRASP